MKSPEAFPDTVSSSSWLTHYLKYKWVKDIRGGPMSDMFGSLRNREVRSNWNRQSACYSSSIVSCLYKLQQQSCSFPRRGHNGELQYHHLHTPSHTLFITASQFFGQKRVGIFFQSFFMQISFRLQSPNWDSVLRDRKNCLHLLVMSSDLPPADVK